ncbi:MAG: DUF4347 domain-containing protein [Drouetiella hepatica Uher 2000/2452]|uniref:DUF4347 domain-containing protein n=1 Tax=Drouetiella hepatica Uher 2000/2452 TaxID=904376 RepID=A0A951UP83_9CYAN|nr:DUF4347 domain-containing protein [Drouetiella hepatica Uher 2000/2452]
MYPATAPNVTILEQPIASSSPLMSSFFQNGSPRSTQTLVAIDSGVDFPKTLAAGVAEGATTLILDAKRDGIAQITAALKQYPEITSLHLFTHGTPGCLHLGNAQLSLDTLDRYAWDLQTWFSPSLNTLHAIPQLLLYACNVAAGNIGIEFIAKLHHLTGANIAASTTTVGNGNWQLDVTTGNIKPFPVFTQALISSYRGTLAEEWIEDTSAQYFNDVIQNNPSNLQGNRQITFADIDRDGDLDLVTGIGNKVYFFKRNGVNGNFSGSGTQINTNGWEKNGLNADFADLDKDGDLDMVVGSDDDRLEQLEGNNGNDFRWEDLLEDDDEHVYDEDDGHPPATYVTIGDVGNGHDNIIIGRTYGKVDFVRINRVVDGEPEYDLDYDDDNGQEALNADNGQVSSNGGAAIPTIGDVDGDGDQDLLVGSSTGGALKYYKYDSGGYKDQTGVNNPFSAWKGAAAIVNLDGIGKKEVVVAFGGTLKVLRSNAQPTIGTQAITLDAIDEDSVAPAGAVGMRVSALVSRSQGTDADGQTLGIAVITADLSEGTWYYSTDDGANWQALPAISDTNALLLGANGRLYFMPQLNENSDNTDYEKASDGKPFFAFKVWDQTKGAVGSQFNPIGNAFSNNTAEAQLIQVNAVADAPTISNIDRSAAEGDLAIYFAKADFESRFQGEDGKSLKKIKVIDLPSDGTLKLSGANVTPGQEIDLNELDNLSFEFDENFNGNVGFTWKATDGQTYSANEASANVNIAWENDLPTISDINRSANEDNAIDFSLSDFIGSFSDPIDADPTLNKAPDLRGNSLQEIQISSLPDPISGALFLSGNAVAINQKIAAGALNGLKFIPNANFNGNISFGWKGSDGEAYANNGASINLTLFSVNDAPVVSPIATGGNEDTTIEFFDSDFISKFFDIDRDVNLNKGSLMPSSLNKIRIISLPSNGTLMLDNSVVSSNQEIGVGELNKLKFVPNANFNGYVSFSWNASDGSLYAVANSTSNITIDPINDIPTVADFNRTLDEDNTVVFAASEFINRFSDIDTDLSLNQHVTKSPRVLSKIQITDLPLTGTLTLNGAAVETNQEIATADLNNLRYVPPKDFNGSINFKWNGHDGSVYALVGATTTINLNPINDRPSDVVPSNTSVLENVDVNTLVATLATRDVDAGDTFNYGLVSGDGDRDNAAFRIAGNKLFVMESPDREAKPAYRVRVRTTDQDGLHIDRAFVIAVLNVDEDPTNLKLSRADLDENIPADTVVGRFSTEDPEGKGTFVYTLEQGIGDNDNRDFTIIGNQLRVNEAPDFEKKSSYKIRVRTADATGLSIERQFEITANDIYESPTDIHLSNDTIRENIDANALIGILSAIDSDRGNDYSYTLVSGDGDSDNELFKIQDNELVLKQSPNFEAKSRHTIRVRTTDDTGLSFTKTLNVKVQNVNEAPTNIRFSEDSVRENTEVGAIAALLTAVDPDENDSFTYRLAAGDGDNDNGSFGIRGNQLILRESPDFEKKSNYKVQVRTTDASGLTYMRAVTLAIKDINEAPTSLLLSNDQIDENVDERTVIGELSSKDQDKGDRFTYTLVNGAGSEDNNAFVIRDSQLLINDSPNFEEKSRYSIRLRTTDDGGLSDDKFLTISIRDLNEKPRVGEAIEDLTTPINEAFRFQVSKKAFKDGDGDRLTLKATLANGDPLPDWLKFDPKTKFFIGKPDLNDIDDLNIKVTASDSEGKSASQTFKLSVKEAYDAQEAKKGLSEGLDRIQTVVDSQMAKVDVPILGKLDKVTPTFIQDLKKGLEGGIGNEKGFSLKEFEKIIQKSLKPYFDRVDVKIDTSQSSKGEVELQISVGNRYNIGSIPLDIDLGLPGLLSLQSQGTVDGAFEYGLSLGIGFSKDLGFFIDTGVTELTAGLGFGLSNDFKATANLGFLQLDVQDNKPKNKKGGKEGGTYVGGEFKLGLNDLDQPSAKDDGDRLTLKELKMKSRDDKLLYADFDINPVIDLKAKTTILGSDVIPSLNFDFKVDWKAFHYSYGKPEPKQTQPMKSAEPEKPLSGKNPGNAQEKPSGNAQEKPSSGKNPGNAQEKLSNDKDLGNAQEKPSGNAQEKPSSGKNPGNAQEKPSNDKNLGNAQEKPSSGKNPGNAQEKPSSGKNPGNAQEKPSNDKDPGNAQEKPSSGKNPGNAQEKPSNDKDPGNAQEKLSNDKNPDIKKPGSVQPHPTKQETVTEIVLESKTITVELKTDVLIDRFIRLGNLPWWIKNEVRRNSSQNAFPIQDPKTRLTTKLTVDRKFLGPNLNSDLMLNGGYKDFNQKTHFDYLKRFEGESAQFLKEHRDWQAALTNGIKGDANAYKATVLKQVQNLINKNALPFGGKDLEELKNAEFSKDFDSFKNKNSLNLEIARIDLKTVTVKVTGKIEVTKTIVKQKDSVPSDKKKTPDTTDTQGGQSQEDSQEGQKPDTKKSDTKKPNSTKQEKSQEDSQGDLQEGQKSDTKKPDTKKPNSTKQEKSQEDSQGDSQEGQKSDTKKPNSTKQEKSQEDAQEDSQEGQKSDTKKSDTKKPNSTKQEKSQEDSQGDSQEGQRPDTKKPDSKKPITSDKNKTSDTTDAQGGQSQDKPNKTSDSDKKLPTATKDKAKTDTLGADKSSNAQDNKKTDLASGKSDGKTGGEAVAKKNKVEKSTIQFNNMQIDLGTFISDFAKPILTKIDEIIKPFSPIIKFLNQDTKLISELGLGSFFDQNRDNKVTIIEIGSTLARKKVDTRFLVALELIEEVTDLIGTLSKQDGNIKIDLGSHKIEFGQDKQGIVKTGNKTATLAKTDVSKQLAQSKVSSQAKNFLTKLNNIEGLQFPILTDPAAAIGLLLGQPSVDLFKYDMPDLDFGFNVHKEFSIWGPIGGLLKGEFKAKTNLSFGFDTFGLDQWKQSSYALNKSYEIFDGFYVDDLPGNELQVNASIEAGAGLNLLAVGGYVKGGIEGKVGLDLVDIGEAKGESDQKLHAISEILPRILKPQDLFNLNGEVNAFLGAEVTSFGDTVWERRFATFQLASFSVGGDNGGKTSNKYIAGATIYLDANFNGLQDANEPFTISNADATYNLQIPMEQFDTNRNGAIDPSEGRLVSLGGTDTFTYLAVETLLAAPAGYSMITPVTTLVSALVQRGLDLTQAQTVVKATLGLPPEIDLASFDPIAAIQSGDSNGVKLMTAHVQIENLIGMTTQFIRGVSKLSVVQISESVVNALLTTGNLSPGSINLSDTAQIQRLIETVVSQLQTTEPSQNWQQLLTLSASAAQVIAEGSQRVATVMTSQSLDSVLEQVSKVQYVLLKETAQDLKAAAAGTKPIAEVIAENTGSGFDAGLTNLEAPSPYGKVVGTEGRDVLRGMQGKVNVMVGYGGDDRLFGETGDDLMSGDEGNDILNGGAGADMLRGGAGRDRLMGNDGNDILVGDSGNDILIGGKGADQFRLEVPASGADQIMDFSVRQDVLEVLVSGSVNGLKVGASLTQRQFRLGAKAMDKSDRFIYNQSTGALFYDADGIGKESKQFKLAELSKGLAVTHQNIVIA